MILSSRKTIDISLLKDVKELVGDGDIDTMSDEEVEKSWGIEILNVQLLEPDITRGVSTALVDNTKSKINKETTITNEEAAKQAKILQGEGESEYEDKVLEVQNTRAIELYDGTTAKTNKKEITLMKEFAKSKVHTLVMSDAQNKPLVTIPINNP